MNVIKSTATGELTKKHAKEHASKFLSLLQKYEKDVFSEN